MIRTDKEAAEQWKLYMQDLYARRLADRQRYGDDCPDLDEDPDGPGSEWSDFQFEWAVDRVHAGRAAGHNGIQAELYNKYSKWAREKLRQQLKQIWESGEFPEALITGKATVSFKSGDSEKYPRYRVLVMFTTEYKIFATILMRRIDDECTWFLWW